jgi:4-alpha-glucanotransferase
MAESGAGAIEHPMGQDERRPPARYAGVLAHPTSLAGPYGIGEFGRGAADFVGWLARAGQTRWQILPLGPTGYGDSPYQAFSTFAGNPLLIALDELRAAGLLDDVDLAGADFTSERVDFGAVLPWKLERLERAAARFRAGGAPQLQADYERFVRAEAGWLDDYALFRAIKDEQGGGAWTDWDAPLRLREERALADARARLSARLDAQRFMQFVFFRQWRALKATASAAGIQIIGDLPIYVALDSADAWANQALFQFDAAGRPLAVSGVPPDYFSATGQLWGNPLYAWEQHAATDYAWWTARLRAVFEMVDILRIDHFRGFEAYWAVPAGEETAQHGRWQPGPGQALFDAARAALGEREVIAEDLGLITPQVDALRRALGYPGMAVLQFAFGSGPDNLYLPHNLERNYVIYTGTHDNDTSRGWYDAADASTRDHVRRYLAADGSDVAWDLLRAAWAAVPTTAIAPLQDVLGLDNSARMNLPGQAGGNWTWRMLPDALTDELATRLHAVTELYGRLGRVE